MARYVKAQLGLHHSVIYADDTGKYFRFSGGTWTWRNHNPGNLVSGKVSKRNNQIGTGTFAIFPDDETSRAALIDCLHTTYEKASIDDLVQAYAPEKDGNNVALYTKFLRDKTGISDNKKVKDFTPTEFDKLWRAIEKMEGYKKGTITEVFPIFEVHKDKDGIYGYHVKMKGWVTKQECMALVKKDKLDLVICKSRLGHEYLRARVGSFVNGSLNHMVVKDPKRGA